MSVELGKIGLFAFFEVAPAGEMREAVAEIEELGFPALWVPEAMGRESLTQAALLLGATERLVVATGIANVFARDALAMVSAQRTLTEAFPDRFVLGMGVSHAPMVEGLRGHDYKKPLTYMRKYLDAMDAAAYMAAPPSTELVRVLAALHPKMLKLAAERSAGSHPYFVPPEHTARAREALGTGKLLAPEQAVVLETDADKARAIGREHMALYLTLPNYVRNLLSLGFSEADVADGGSDKLVDAIVAWGDLGAIAARIRAHQDAGADHVCLQVLTADQQRLPRAEWRELAALLS